MIHHLILIYRNTVFIQHIKQPLKFCDMRLKYKISLILVEYFL